MTETDYEIIFAFVTSEREEKYRDTEMTKIVPDLYDEERLNMEGGEVSETPDEDMETIRHSEKIVSELMDNLITDIIKEIETVRQSENDVQKIVRDLMDEIISDLII